MPFIHKIKETKNGFVQLIIKNGLVEKVSKTCEHIGLSFTSISVPAGMKYGVFTPLGEDGKGIKCSSTEGKKWMGLQKDTTISGIKISNQRLLKQDGEPYDNLYSTVAD